MMFLFERHGFYSLWPFSMNNILHQQKGMTDCFAPNEKVVTRRYPITNSCHFKRDLTKMTMETTQQVKQYGLVYTKRVIDRDTFQTYPSGNEDK